eukprot:TRINITY_DN4977_c0_g1_i2.p2 TRINITY_DN4977_c0_g1~~TRINITY_DN4977_c0_g1_i2.p2  ORF type:complete len:244 (-),score=47.74 TRINITY_DN4977_c0_g1_i2:1176-1811(-)
MEKHKLELEEMTAKWDPNLNPDAKGDPIKTLFVARIEYDVTERQLKHEFERFGPIKRAKVVTDKITGKSRGYAFIEFREEEDMIAAYKKGDGLKMNGMRVLVDVERGRTVKGWKPRRLGGGLGATRKGGDDVNQKYSGREPPAMAESSYRPRSSGRGYRSRRSGSRDDRYSSSNSHHRGSRGDGRRPSYYKSSGRHGGRRDSRDPRERYRR